MLTHSIEAAAAPGQDGTISLAFELSKSRWLVAKLLPGSSKISRFRLDGGDTAGLLQLLTEARRKAAQLGFPKARIVSCYEAGYDGFWLHRWLLDHGVDNRVLDPAGIELPRRARSAKADKIDLDFLVRYTNAPWLVIQDEGAAERRGRIVPLRRTGRATDIAPVAKRLTRLLPVVFPLESTPMSMPGREIPTHRRLKIRWHEPKRAPERWYSPPVWLQSMPHY